MCAVSSLWALWTLTPSFPAQFCLPQPSFPSQKGVFLSSWATVKYLYILDIIPLHVEPKNNLSQYVDICHCLYYCLHSFLSEEGDLVCSWDAVGFHNCHFIILAPGNFTERQDVLSFVLRGLSLSSVERLQPYIDLQHRGKTPGGRDHIFTIRCWYQWGKPRAVS